MADDKLKIVATLDDQVTGPLGKVEGVLKRAADGTKGAATGMRKEWDAFKGVLGQTSSALSTFASPLAALGIAGGGAALSIGALGGAMRSFSQNTQSLDILSKQTGITVKTLQALENMGERVGISGQTMLGAADNFSRAATRLKRGYSEAMQELPGMNLGWLLNDLKAAGSVEEMMNKLFEDLPKISNLEARRRVLTMFFGTEEIDKIIQEYGQQAGKKLQEIRQSVADITPEAKQAAKEFEDMVGRWNAAVEKSKVWALTPLLKSVVTLFDSAEQKGLRGNEQGVDKSLTAQRDRKQARIDYLKDHAEGDPSAAAKIERLSREVARLDAELRRSREGGGAYQADGIPTDTGPAPTAIPPSPRQGLEGRRTQVQRQLDLLEQGPRDGDYERKHTRMIEELKRVGDELQKLREQGATAQPSSFEAPGGMGGLIQKASFGGSGSGMPRSFGGAGVYGGPGGGSGGGGPDAPRDVPAAPSIGEGMRGRPFGSKPAVPGHSSPPSDPPGGYSGNDGRRAARTGMTAAGRQNVASWMEFFRKPVDQGGMGYTDEQARGQVAMMQGESGLNLNPGAMGDKDARGVPHAFGTVQWSDAKGNDRFPRLRALATEMGKDWRDRSVQQEMYRREMLGRYRGAYNRVRGAQTGEQSLWAGIQSYENPREHGLAYAIRRPFLNRLRRDASNPPGPAVDTAEAKPPTQADGDYFPNGAPRVMKPKSMAGDPSVPGVVMDRGSPAGGDSIKQLKPWTKADAKPSKDAGDALMDRFYGRGAPGAGQTMQMPGGSGAGGKGTLHIKLSGAPPGTKVDHDMDGLFRGVTISRHRPAQMDDI
ncbi:phage tail tip lysozyme [Methylobacterium sp. J-070]|uniref:phage tail tip lysozyme n=1 Tax=Methylobacterium sp. J-070 TaxID=2836650 RepID=UPI001FB9036E|nr:phage tail tip lysozyme [Methylobacterium sp. J-070]MCJ2051206.1 phage tail tip lysozyme [Methylobacterium sp. J-070]